MSAKEKWAVVTDLTATIAAIDWITMAQIVRMILDLLKWLDNIDGE